MKQKLIHILFVLFILAGIVVQARLAPETSKAQEVVDTVEQTSWGYLYHLQSGDTVEVGDSTTTDFKAVLKTIHKPDKWFSIGWAGGTFTPTLDGLAVSFQFNNTINVSIYPVPPSERLPNGGMEYDVTLSRKTNQPSLSLDIDWEGITWQKIYGLDVDYDETRCEEKWGIDAAPYTITPTSITGSDAVVYKTRAEYEVNSYVGTAVDPTVNNVEVIGISSKNGLPITRTTPSRTHLYIHRGQITDDLGETAWVEDIDLNESQHTLTFYLPSDWLKNASYPVRGVCGVDPAYTEDIDYFLTSAQLASDGWNADIDFNSIFGCPADSVAEVIFGNQENGVENTFGLRNTSSSDNRTVTLHEAEGGGQTHCRMFTQLDGSGLCDCYHSDVSDDDYFYLVGYWENVTFTEYWPPGGAGEANSTGSWVDEVLPSGSSGASKVHHIIFCSSGFQDTANTRGFRTKGSALERKILVHESESGGYNLLDLMVKADSSYTVQLYFSGDVTYYWDTGYFDDSLDFVELWSYYSPSAAGWYNQDVTSDLDEDGRITDWMCLNWQDAYTRDIGVRGGDSAASRTLNEHEAESADHSTPEYSGFSMSAQSNSSGEVGIYSPQNGYGVYYLTGYFKPASAVTNISNTPATYDYGVMAASATSATGLDYFTVTNSSGFAVDIAISGTDATGGTTWTLSDTATPGANTFGMLAGLDGGNYSIIVKKTATFNYLVENLADSGNQSWGLEFLAPTSYPNEPDEKTAVIELIATAH